ncbi:hypothetical protein BDZ91DRAFT_768782 [Kalaharituber pfeilii]|nr:hypothetical protein BDZ91DRAFT_768782 [Kalaharituber pfeilii]
MSPPFLSQSQNPPPQLHPPPSSLTSPTTPLTPVNPSQESLDAWGCRIQLTTDCQSLGCWISVLDKYPYLQAPGIPRYFLPRTFCFHTLLPALVAYVKYAVNPKEYPLSPTVLATLAIEEPETPWAHMPTALGRRWLRWLVENRIRLHLTAMEPHINNQANERWMAVWWEMASRTLYMLLGDIQAGMELADKAEAVAWEAAQPPMTPLTEEVVKKRSTQAKGAEIKSENDTPKPTGKTDRPTPTSKPESSPGESSSPKSTISFKEAEEARLCEYRRKVKSIIQVRQWNSVCLYRQDIWRMHWDRRPWNPAASAAAWFKGPLAPNPIPGMRKEPRGKKIVFPLIRVPLKPKLKEWELDLDEMHQEFWREERGVDAPREEEYVIEGNSNWGRIPKFEEMRHGGLRRNGHLSNRLATDFSFKPIHYNSRDNSEVLARVSNMPWQPQNFLVLFDISPVYAGYTKRSTGMSPSSQFSDWMEVGIRGASQIYI